MIQCFPGGWFGVLAFVTIVAFLVWEFKLQGLVLGGTLFFVAVAFFVWSCVYFLNCETPKEQFWFLLAELSTFAACEIALAVWRFDRGVSKPGE